MPILSPVKLYTHIRIVFIIQAYSVIGRDHSSICESITAVVEMNTNSPLPTINEEHISGSVFSPSSSVTSEEMLAAIRGDTSLCKNTLSSNSAVDSGFDGKNKDDCPNKTSSPGQDHYMLQESIEHYRSRQQNTLIVKVAYEHHHHHSCSDDNDSVFSDITLSDYGSDGNIEMDHPDHYAVIPQNTTLDNHMSSSYGDDDSTRGLISSSI